jgi:hypothetical protein
MFEWLTFALIFFCVWLAIFVSRPGLRKEMLWISIFTAPFGLTEPIFVPDYWNPPSLFNLANTTGFDIESLIFCFAIGGIASVIYETIFKVDHRQSKSNFLKNPTFWAILFIPILTFLPLLVFTQTNPIYSASIALLMGGFTTIILRRDLDRKVLVGGVLFTIIYFVFFYLFSLIYPGIVERVWNLEALSGILLAGIPIEEFMFAFTFGMLWSGLYEVAVKNKLNYAKQTRRLLTN